MLRQKEKVVLRALEVFFFLDFDAFGLQSCPTGGPSPQCLLPDIDLALDESGGPCQGGVPLIGGSAGCFLFFLF